MDLCRYNISMTCIGVSKCSVYSYACCMFFFSHYPWMCGWWFKSVLDHLFELSVSPRIWNTIEFFLGYHQSPERWQKGTTPVPIGWMAGEQYDGDTNRTAHILGNLSAYYPGATDYEVAGFFWWQGDRDSRDMASSCATSVCLYQAPNTGVFLCIS